ncbi:sulfotransferase [Sphingobium sp. AS12]|uniref:sulfotransferase family protein n=1 Tax=Sphingobium sp. AS12 TaxID=2849495 RepID=UPI0020C91790|nr:sulfotransferase [Sphingobium sp. AS12]
MFVLGAQKCGTTALCDLLNNHPDCLVSEPKEPNYFSRAVNLPDDALLRSYYKKAAGEKYFIDGTTTYLADPEIASRIAGRLGKDIRFIVALRNPVSRAFSGFMHMVKRGHERRTAEEVFLSLSDDPLEAALTERVAVAKAAAYKQVVIPIYAKQYDDVLWNYRYLGNTLYSAQVEVFDRIFGTDSVLVLLFEDLIKNMEGENAKIATFLGVDGSSFPDVLPSRNITSVGNTATFLGRMEEQARRIKRGNFVMVRREEGDVSKEATPQIKQKLATIFAGETEYWSKRLDRNLAEIGWPVARKPE